ncbi:thiamine pyrophosphate-binding protein [uncultured Tateyamaria sp.]|uniref:thiamine pyrophosphate-binding protein n=1 Tax=Tateyamaria sp. 1078 TaxID=3417464 RepID=UPI0026312F22|nr:thiamine pyrophosphate-binding protein [uncultured Tateyamaria sp.]
MPKDTTPTGAQVLVDCLVSAEIDTVFGVPGEETTEVMAALDASGIDFVLCRNEQGAAFMASVHGRLTGRPGVCLATLGPGATNLVTGVADAQLDHVPLIAITGQGARDRLGRMSHQMIDLEALFAPITKLSRTILMPDDIPASFAEAMRLALDGRPGAVHLCLPEDVAAAPCASTPLPVRTPPQIRAGQDDLQAVADRLAQAQRPVIVAGAGAVRDGAAEAVRMFAETTGVPVATTFMAKGILPPDHDATLFSVGQSEEDWTDLALQAADLILLIGFDAVEYPPLGLGGDAEVCVIDTDPPRADTGLEISASAVGDIGHSLTDMRLRLKGQRWAPVPAFVAARDGMRLAMERRLTGDDTGAVAPTDICRVVTSALRPEDTVLSGVGMHKLWIARHVQPLRAGQLIVPNGLAGMGLALPGAVAAARLQDTGRVLAICGDGDVMMNVQEMETITRLGLRLTVMVWVDGGLGLIDDHQGEEGPDFPFANPMWGQLARAFGWTFAPVTGLGDLPMLLRAALSAEGPTLLTVPVDYAAAGHMPARDLNLSGNSDAA